MVDRNKKRTSLSVSTEIRTMLKSVKHPGQSYSGVIQELVNFWMKQKGIETNGDNEA